MYICIYGASSKTIDPIYVNAVEELGKKAALRGHGLVFGGGNAGCMGAAARGFHAENGEILAVVPRFFRVDGVLYPHASRMFFTDTMRERKQLLESLSDVFVVSPGGAGTFDEFFEILALKQLGRHTKAIAIYNPGGFYDELLSFLKSVAQKNFMNEKVNTELYRVFSDPDELLDYLEAYVPQEQDPAALKDIGVAK